MTLIPLVEHIDEVQALFPDVELYKEESKHGSMYYAKGAISAKMATDFVASRHSLIHLCRQVSRRIYDWN